MPSSIDIKTIRAVYVNGVFRPLEAVELAEGTEVKFEPRLFHATRHSDESLDAIYAILSERYRSGEPDVAKRHNER